MLPGNLDSQSEPGAELGEMAMDWRREWQRRVVGGDVVRVGWTNRAGGEACLAGPHLRRDLPGRPTIVAGAHSPTRWYYMAAYGTAHAAAVTAGDLLHAPSPSLVPGPERRVRGGGAGPAGRIRIV